MRDRALTALALTLMLGSGCGRGATRGTGIALAPCQLTHPSAAASASARCGTLEVPEDWRHPSGRRLSLRVAVIASESGSATPDALFFLAGGPGQAATEQYPVVASALAGARRGRDVVLVDQRGTGGSGPLTCANPEGAASAAPEDEVQRLGACARQLAASGTELAHYGTLDFVRDLEAVRAALGYPRVNLVAVSYGTRAALGWLRAHPERIRALVLDGVVAPGVAIGASAAADARRALELHLRRCRADAACRARFPGLEARSADLLLRLARAPARLSVPDPLLGTPRAVELGPAQARRVGELLAYAPETAALWPLLVERAAAGDLVPLAAQ
ncbi:MAG TPA: alpha/beta fold hydrolase, partial [Anaeromyxobacteraceae bacterium]